MPSSTRLASACAILATLLSSAGLATIPDYDAAVTRCANLGALVSYNATCQPLPQASVCSPYFPVNQSVYVPMETFLSDMEHSAVLAMETTVSNKAFFSPACFAYTLAQICTTHFYPCLDSGNPYEPLPVIPCAQFCGAYWSACNETFFFYWSEEIKTNYVTSTLPNCLHGGTFESTWTSGSLTAVPQPPDTWGGRAIPSSGMPTIFGLNGTLLFPDGSYNYTFTNGSIASLTCYMPNASQITVSIPPPKCVAPLVVSARGDSCDLLCPFPVFDVDTQQSVEWAFVAPALIGLVLSVFTCVDSIIVLKRMGGLRRNLREILCPRLAQDSSSSPKPVTSVKSKGSNKLHASSVYALIGSILGIVYFLIGPMVTLIEWSNVSCTDPVLSLSALTAGTMPPEPSGCVAQRVAPFILQAIFNLILYALVRIYQTIATAQLKLRNAKIKFLAEIALVGYCVCGPFVTLVAAFGLDKLSTDAFTGFIQLSRQSTVCQFRLSAASEWILTFVPFVITGVAVLGMSVVITDELRLTTGKLQRTRSPDALNERTVSDVTLRLFILRLVGLGIVTFVVLIVVIVSSSLVTSELEAFTPAFSTYFRCFTQDMTCLNCSVWKDIAAERTPNPAVLAVQLASMSCIMLLFSLFFGGETLARIYKERIYGPAHVTNMLGGKVTSKTDVIQSAVGFEGTQLSNILTTPGLSEAFYGHLSTEHSSEILEFLYRVENYRAKWSATTPDANRSLAQEIFRIYIDITGKSPVNLSSTVVSSIERCINDTEPIPSTVFDAAAHEISKLVERDGMARFVQTPRFKVETVVHSLGL